MGVPTRVILRGMFGKPTLQWLKNNGTESNGRATWVKEWDRYGQWTAKLSPGYQTDDDYGSVSFTVNNMPLVDLKSIEYIYRMSATEVVAPNIAIHVFDPADTDNRADITYSHSADALGVTSGWKKFELLPASTAAMFYYGNNIPTTTGLTGDTGTNLYTLAQYQADPVFKNYVIGKITIEYGYYSTGFLSPAHICKVVVNKVDLELEPSIEEQVDLMRDDVAKAQRTIPAWTFGDPVLRCAGVSKVGWVQDTGNAIRLFQKGASGYLANLYGGVQDGASWAAVYIPVNELRVSDFTSALWTYHLTNAESCGVNLVVWAHDPTDNMKRVEITQVMGLVDKAQYWNGHELDTTVTQFFYNGEGVSGSDRTAGTNYTWDQFREDPVFSEWTIYRISLEYGWIGSSTLEDAWVADAKLNGQVILLKPQPWDVMGRETKSVYLATVSDATVDVAIITPAATKRVRIKNVFITTTTATVYNYQVYFSVNDSMPAAKVIAHMALGTDKVSSVSIPYGDNGPLGEIGEAVSILVSNNVTDTGAFVIVYNEE